MMNKPSSQQRAALRFLEIAALILILALAAYLRLENHTDNPGWYTDEGTHLNIAQNLLQGRIQYLAINQSTLLFAKMPLFEILLAALLGVWGGGIGTLRALTGVLGAVSAGALYWVVRRTQQGSASLALLSALMYSIHPQAALYSRFGFSYNLLTPLVLLTCLGLWEYLGATPQGNSRRGWLALAALAIGIGSISDLWMFALTAPVMLIVSTRNWRDLIWSLALQFVPFGLYAATMLVNAPQAFWFDLGWTLFRLSRLSPKEQLATLALNYTLLVSQVQWAALAIVGLFMLRPIRLQRLSLLLFLFPIIMLGRTAALYGLSSYYLIPLLPFVGLGIASIVKHGVPFASQTICAALLDLFQRWGWSPTQLAWQRLQGKAVITGTSLILLFVVATPFLTLTARTVKQVTDVFNTEIDPLLINPVHARQAAEFINSRTAPGDLVIASPGLAWLLRANMADLTMSALFAGQGTSDLPSNVPKDRFAFDPHYTRARFIVVDNLWYNWGVWNVPGASDVIHQLKTWPLAFKAGEIEVYCNPAQLR